jgi:hypothetical protein
LRQCPNNLFIAVNKANLVISIPDDFNLQKSLDFETVPKIKYDFAFPYCGMCALVAETTFDAKPFNGKNL